MLSNTRRAKHTLVNLPWSMFMGVQISAVRRDGCFFKRFVWASTWERSRRLTDGSGHDNSSERDCGGSKPMMNVGGRRPAEASGLRTKHDFIGNVAGYSWPGTDQRWHLRVLALDLGSRPVRSLPRSITAAILPTLLSRKQAKNKFRVESGR